MQPFPTTALSVLLGVYEHPFVLQSVNIIFFKDFSIGSITMTSLILQILSVIKIQEKALPWFIFVKFINKLTSEFSNS